MIYPLHASCQCGQVSYQLNQAPVKVIACHCQECQKLSTSPFSITAVVDTRQIQFNGEMKTWSRIAESGNENQATFCPVCGTRIYHLNPAQPELIKLKLKPTGTKVDTDFAPSIHVWTCEKQAWFNIPAGVNTALKQP